MKKRSVLQDLQRGMLRNGLDAIDQTGRGQQQVFHMTGWITRHFSVIGIDAVSLHWRRTSVSATDQSVSHSDIGKSVEHCSSS